MPIPFSLLHFISLLLALTLTSGSGCPTKCGSLHIRYPFGVGSDCSMGPSFNIVCNKSSNPPKPYLDITNKLLEIIEIKPTQIRVKYPHILAATCYNNTAVYPHNVTRDDYYYINLEETQYAMSDQNWLTAVGCDDFVAGFGQNNQSFAGGCVSYCPKNDSRFGLCPNDENGYSAGNGCCRTPIPEGTTFLATQLSDLSGKWVRDKYFPCSYAFVEEKRIANESTFSYPFSDLSNSIISEDDSWAFTSSPPPVVRLDWRVGRKNCSTAHRNSSTFACKENSVCVDFEANNGGAEGYLCRCIQGYDGNPYQNKGCQDIDECANSALNPCDANAICTNTIGSVNCSCRKGYFGDGRKNGKGCIPSNMINVFIGVGSGMGFLLLLSMCILAYILLQKRKNKLRKEKFFKRNGGLLLRQQTYEGAIDQKTKLFSSEELEKATDNFNESRILGQGGQGTVYKGMLSDGKIVAIKKSKLGDKALLEQFINEVVILSQINHKNVVKLWGCCLETEVPLLVYELVPNGTLFDLIHDPATDVQVSWSMRLKIAANIAGALAYLHSALSIPIYHRDIKTSNILLDEKYTVKLSDFGISISRSVATDRTHLTTLVKGTFGYFDPEYFQSNQFTEKSDVYSFGVVLVELLTGQRPISVDINEEDKSLAMRFLACMEEDNFDIILDPQVLKHGKDEEVIAVAWLAQRCLNWKGKLRPTMKEVATELESLMISEEARVCEAKSTMISDIEYMWTNSGISEESSSHILPFSYDIV